MGLDFAEKAVRQALLNLSADRRARRNHAGGVRPRLAGGIIARSGWPWLRS